MAVPRRRFVQGLSAAAGIAAIGWPLSALRAFEPISPAELGGTEFDLDIEPLPVNFTGRPRYATAINGRVPGPVLRVREGDTITLRVRNRLNEMTAIHWHGMIVPPEMDGVPGISFGVRCIGR